MDERDRNSTTLPKIMPGGYRVIVIIANAYANASWAAEKHVHACHDDQRWLLRWMLMEMVDVVE